MSLKSHLVVYKLPMHQQLSMWHNPTTKSHVFNLPQLMLGLPYNFWIDAYLFAHDRMTIHMWSLRKDILTERSCEVTHDYTCETFYSKTCLKRPLKKKTKIGFQDRLSLDAGQRYCRMLQGSILQYFRPSFSYYLSLRSLFCLFWSGGLRQVLL